MRSVQEACWSCTSKLEGERVCVCTSILELYKSGGKHFTSSHKHIASYSLLRSRNHLNCVKQREREREREKFEWKMHYSILLF